MSEERTNGNRPSENTASDNVSQAAERPLSVNRGCEGCLASLLFLITCGLILVSGVLQALQIDHMLDPLTLGQTKVVLTGIWLAAMFFGGFVAARRGRTTGWSNVLAVGIFGLFFALGQLGEDVGLAAALARIWREPSARWTQLTAVVLTVG